MSDQRVRRTLKDLAQPPPNVNVDQRHRLRIPHTLVKGGGPYSKLVSAWSTRLLILGQGRVPGFADRHSQRCEVPRSKTGKSQLVNPDLMEGGPHRREAKVRGEIRERFDAMNGAPRTNFRG
jgi:hypothetical protein